MVHPQGAFNLPRGARERHLLKLVQLQIWSHIQNPALAVPQGHALPQVQAPASGPAHAAAPMPAPAPAPLHPAANATLAQVPPAVILPAAGQPIQPPQMPAQQEVIAAGGAQAVAQALQQALGQAQQQPGEAVNSFLTAGTTLDPKIKAKIWNGEYVDLGSLRSQVSSSLGMTVVEGIDGQPQVALTPARNKAPQTIYDWQRLYHTYAAVFLQRHPTQGPAIFTYLTRILDLHRQHGGTVWRLYDEQFRRLRAHLPTLPWHVLNWQVLNDAMVNQPQSSSNFQEPKDRVCFAFNRKGFCKLEEKCQYKHICSLCKSPSHPKSRCHKQSLSHESDSDQASS